MRGKSYEKLYAIRYQNLVGINRIFNYMEKYRISNVNVLNMSTFLYGL